MIARLTRFYGLDPCRWLAELPLGIVRAYSRMIPRLKAEESIEAVRRTGVGTGSLSADASAATIAGWEQTIGVASRYVVQRPTAAAFAGMGFGIRRVPKTA